MFKKIYCGATPIAGTHISEMATKALCLPTYFTRYSKHTSAPFLSQRSSQRKKIVTILGGIHGNELVGVEIIRWLQDLLGSVPFSTFDSMSGELILGLGNPQAIEAGTRACSKVDDLNRCFIVNEGCIKQKKILSYEEQRSLDIRPLLKETDILLDIHATNKPSLPFIRIAGEQFTLRHQDVLKYFPHARILLRDAQHTIGNGEISTTDEFVQYNGGIGICYEVGQAADMSCIDVVKNEVAEFLEKEVNLYLPEGSAEQMTCLTDDDKTSVANLEIFEMVEAITLLRKHKFEWASGICNASNSVAMGSENFQKVFANQPIGYMFDDLGNEKVVSSPFDGYLVFPKVEELMVEGKPLVWIARKKD